MIYAIMGSQGSGKTTVLQELQHRGWNVITRKTSRSILDEWGLTLDDVHHDEELTTRFQDEVLARKITDDLDHDPSEVWFTERTFTDLFVYTLISLGKNNTYTDWVNHYYDACAQAQAHYNGIFYLMGGLFNIEHDGVRGANQHYGKMVDLTMKHFAHVMSSQPIIEINFADLKQRVDFIEQNVLESRYPNKGKQ